MKSTMSILGKKVEFPIYGVDFAADDTLILAGGGGANHSGVKNQLTCLKIQREEKALKDIKTMNLSEKEDCPMSLSCHPDLPLTAVGINSSEEEIEQGNNLSCRIFETASDGNITLKTKLKTSNCTSSEEYQKIIAFSRPTGRYLASGFSDGRVTVLKKDDSGWRLCFPSAKFNQPIQDIDFDAQEEYMVVTTSTALIILCVHDGSGDIVQVIDSPKLNKNTRCEYKAGRYGVHKGQERLYAIVNPAQRGGKGAYITAWILQPSLANKYPIRTKLAKTARISRKSITHLRVSPAGDILAYASSDLSIGFIDTVTLKPLYKIKEAHGFAITGLNFSKGGNYLASGSADTSCKVLILPKNIRDMQQDNDDNAFITFILAIMDMALFALLMHIIVQMVDQGTL